MKRNWKFYTKEKLLAKLSTVNWSINNDDVQSYWNSFESKLIEVVDDLCPLITLENLLNFKSKPPHFIKQKINKQNNLLKKVKRNPTNSQSARSELKNLNKEIK